MALKKIRWPFPKLRLRTSTLILLVVGSVFLAFALLFSPALSLIAVNFAKIPLLLATVDVLDGTIFRDINVTEQIRSGNLAVAVVYASLYIMGAIILAPI